MEIEQRGTKRRIFRETSGQISAYLSLRVADGGTWTGKGAGGKGNERTSSKTRPSLSLCFMPFIHLLHVRHPSTKRMSPFWMRFRQHICSLAIFFPSDTHLQRLHRELLPVFFPQQPFAFRLQIVTLGGDVVEFNHTIFLQINLASNEKREISFEPNW